MTGIEQHIHGCRFFDKFSLSNVTAASIHLPAWQLTSVFRRGWQIRKRPHFTLCRPVKSWRRVTTWMFSWEGSRSPQAPVDSALIIRHVKSLTFCRRTVDGARKTEWLLGQFMGDQCTQLVSKHDYRRAAYTQWCEVVVCDPRDFIQRCVWQRQFVTAMTKTRRLRQPADAAFEESFSSQNQLIP